MKFIIFIIIKKGRQFKAGRETPSSLGGANYFLTFIDEATLYSWVYFLKTKNEVYTKFREWRVLVEN